MEFHPKIALKIRQPTVRRAAPLAALLNQVHDTTPRIINHRALTRKPAAEKPTAPIALSTKLFLIFGPALTHQWCFKVRCGIWRPRLRHDAVNRVLLRTIYRLHEQRGGKLCLCLNRLRVHTGIHHPVTILSKKRVDGFYPCLKNSKSHWGKRRSRTRNLSCLPRRDVKRKQVDGCFQIKTLIKINRDDILTAWKGKVQAALAGESSTFWINSALYSRNCPDAHFDSSSRGTNSAIQPDL